VLWNRANGIPSLYSPSDRAALKHIAKLVSFLARNRLLVIPPSSYRDKVVSIASLIGRRNITDKQLRLLVGAYEEDRRIRIDKALPRAEALYEEYRAKKT
jgi:hypothetical protein